MKVIRRSPNKFWIFVGGKSFVLRLEREARLARRSFSEGGLLPRWRVASGLFLSALFAGAGFGVHQPIIGFSMLAVALACLWWLGR